MRSRHPRCWIGAIVVPLLIEIGQADDDVGRMRYLGSFNGHCYYLGTPGTVDVGRRQADSLRTALRRKVYLAAVNSRAEEKWLIERIGGQECWIGLSDEEIEGTFVWDSREPVTFANWGPPGGEPTDFGACPVQGVNCRCEDHVVINGHLPGPGSHWNDLAGMCWTRPGLIEVEGCDVVRHERLPIWAELPKQLGELVARIRWNLVGAHASNDDFRAVVAFSFDGRTVKTPQHRQLARVRECVGDGTLKKSRKVVLNRF